MKFTLILSFLFFALLLFMIIRWIVRAARVKASYRSGGIDIALKPDTHTELWKCSLFLILSVVFLHIAIGLFASGFDHESPESAMNWFEIVLNRIIRALQMFSMDESYTESINTGKQMISCLLADTWIDKIGAAPVFVALFGGYHSILNLMAPIAGGAILFEIIISVFPMLEFVIVNKCFWKAKYYFSELNDKSLALAINMMSDPEYRKGIIIFTDAYADDKDEASAERLPAGKAIGAICLKDDLKSIKISRCTLKQNRVLLIDDDENANLEALAELIELRNSKAMDKTEIYVFSTDNRTSFLEEEIAYMLSRKESEIENLGCFEENYRKRLKKALAKNRRAKAVIPEYEISKKLREECRNNDLDRIRKKISSKHPEYDCEKTESEAENELSNLIKQNINKLESRIIPVNGIRNLARGLFYKIPLYEPIVNRRVKDGKTRLNVTILGSGVIGTEIFLSAYWFGQILDTELKINVVSQESEEDFKGRINYINPDIFATSYDRENPKKELLRSAKGVYEDPYFIFSYHQKDVLSEDFSEFLSAKQEDDPDYTLLDTDYFIVALGSDEDNFLLADKLRKEVAKRHMTDKGKEKRTVISYIVYNSDLCLTLNSDSRHNYTVNTLYGGAKNPEDDKFDIYMYAFGSMSEVYSLRNVFLEGIIDTAVDIGKNYSIDKKTLDSDEKKRKKNNKERFKDVYTYQANVGRAFHRKYRVYSAGKYKRSLFTTTRDDEYQKIQTESECEYNSFLGAEKKKESDIRLLNRMAWLEHRRWCAFFRVNGFRRPDDGLFDNYYGMRVGEHPEANHKFTTVKLHPCLVECTDVGINADFDDLGIVISETELAGVPEDQSKEAWCRDRLDELTYDMKVKGERFKEEHKDVKDLNRIDAYDYKLWDYPVYGLSDNEIKAIIKKRVVSPGYKTGESTILRSISWMKIYTFGDHIFISVDSLRHAAKKISDKDKISDMERQLIRIIFPSEEDKASKDNNRIAKALEDNGIPLSKKIRGVGFVDIDDVAKYLKLPVRQTEAGS